jgi:hypothetical protein
VIGRQRRFRKVQSLKVLLGLLALAAGPLSAQSVSGIVIRETDDTSAPLEGAWVVLHRVTEAARGPVDSLRSGADGRFRFRLTSDTAVVNLVSTRHDGIDYFSIPFDGRASDSVTLVVHDTSSRVPVIVATRHVLIGRPAEDGAREALDLILLLNASTKTRVAPDSLGASWAGPLPAKSRGLELNRGDISPDAVLRRGDSAIVSAPLAPGERQLAFLYRLPAGRQTVEIPMGPDSVGVNLLVEEEGATVAGPGIALADSQVIEGRAFPRWSGDVAPNTIVRVTLPGADPTAPRILAVLVLVLALALVAAAWRLLPRARPISTDRLIGEIALMDVRYQGRESETSPEEWARYLERRGKLKAELEAALARGSAGR